MIPDPELVRRTLAEGAFHFGPLVQRHSDYIFGLNMRLTSGNRALAQDITQQTFLNAFTYLKSFDRTKAFKHWIAGIAVNCFKDAIKKKTFTFPLMPLISLTPLTLISRPLKVFIHQSRKWTALFWH